MRAWIILVALLLPLTSNAVTLKNEKLEAPGIGTIEFKHENPGEPIAQPERLQVFLTCLKGGRKTKIAAYRLCQFSSFEYESGIKSLHLKLISGRVNPKSGNVTCDLADDKHLDLSKFCN